jgi:hypothetical protein
VRHTTPYHEIKSGPAGIHSVLLLILFFLAAPLIAPAQAPLSADYRETPIQPKPIDRPTWRKTIEGLDYRSHTREKAPEETQSRSPQPQQQKDSSNPLMDRGWRLSGKLLQIIGRIILIGGAATLLFFLLRSLLRMEWTPRNKPIQKEGHMTIDIEKVEEDIAAFDLEALVRQALTGGQYPLALRLYYLLALKELSRSRLIRWKKGKTNRDYLREMQASPLAGDFRRLTRAFEQIWYGQHAFAEEDFYTLEPHFQRFVTRLRENRPPVTKGNP